jgi:spore maturation protein CgeB
MWNISHPDKIQDEEYNSYDHVFVASESYPQVLSKRLNVSVTPLLQCTDPEIFYPDPNPEVPFETLLFVGNSRKQFREAVRLAVKADLPVAVYGTHWSGLIPAANIRGEYIENARLRQYYNRCDILLNDHWPTMRESGFVSNRIFDAAAAGAFILSDRVVDAEDILGEDLITFETEEEFYNLVEHYLERPDERRQQAERLRSSVLQGHTFAHRVEAILQKVKTIDHCERSAGQLVGSGLGLAGSASNNDR